MLLMLTIRLHTAQMTYYCFVFKVELQFDFSYFAQHIHLQIINFQLTQTFISIT